MVDVEAPRLLKVQSHSVNTTQKDSCIQGKRPPPLGRSSDTCAQGGEELLGPCLCLTQASPRAQTPSHESQHSLLLTQGSRRASASAAGPPCGVSTGSPRRTPSGPSAVFSASFPPERNVREKSERSNRQTSFCPWDRSGRELKGVPDAALSRDDLHSVHLFPPLTFCPDHPSRKPALPRAQYHAFSLL